jgi:hypothetical protein
MIDMKGIIVLFKKVRQIVSQTKQRYVSRREAEQIRQGALRANQCEYDTRVWLR